MSSTRFARIRSLLGDDNETAEPAVAEAEFTPPQDVSDPATLADETQPSLLERLHDNWIPVALGTFGALVVLVLAVIWGGQFLLGIVTNFWVQRGVLALALIGGGYVAGVGAGKQQVAGHDKLMLHNPESGETLTFLGELLHAREGRHPVFVPYRGGLDGIRGSGTPYDANTLTPALPGGVPAQIRLHPGAAGTTATEWGGMQAVQITGGLRPDPDGAESNIEATLPDQASEATMADLTDELETAEREIGTLRRTLSTVKRQRDAAFEAAEKPREELQRELEDYRDLFAVFASGTSKSLDDDGDDYDHEETMRELLEDAE